MKNDPKETCFICDSREQPFQVYQIGSQKYPLCPSCNNARYWQMIKTTLTHDKHEALKEA